MIFRIIPVAPAILLLAACGNEPEGESEVGGRAAGEVLGGTISDEMIALDQLTSQSPPEVSEPGAGGTAAEEGSVDEGEAAANPPSEPDAAPQGDPAIPDAE